MFSKVVGGNAVESFLLKFVEGFILMLLHLSAGWIDDTIISNLIYFIWFINTLGIDIFKIVTEFLPVNILLFDVLLKIWVVGLADFHHFLRDIILFGSSDKRSFWAVGVVEGQHVVVWPSVHLDWEDGCLERKSFETHLVDPWFEVEVINGGYCIIFLLLGEFVIVLSWRVYSQKHGLCRKDTCVVPWCLDVDLGEVIELIKELIGSFSIFSVFYISVS